jgi:hypothetical protein
VPFGDQTEARHAFLNRLTADNTVATTARLDPLFLALDKRNERTQAISRTELELRIEASPSLPKRFQYRPVGQRGGFKKKICNRLRAR